MQLNVWLNQLVVSFRGMKKCFYFPRWEEQKDVMISLDDLNQLQT